MKTSLVVSPVFALIFLGGCAFGHYWTKAGSTETDFKRDYYRCYQEARYWSAGEASRSRKMCLEASGWEMDGMRLGFSGRWKATENNAVDQPAADLRGQTGRGL